MLHRDTLKLLFPLEIGGALDADIAIEGDHLDAAQLRAEALLKEIFPDRSYELLAAWERVCGLMSGADDTLQLRRDRVIRKLRELGGQSRAYFIGLAETLGYTVTIEEMQPFMCGWSACGDPLYVEAVRFVWRVNVAGGTLYYFRTGLSVTGERLLSWDSALALEGVFNELKPAHTFIIFNYS